MNDIQLFNDNLPFGDMTKEEIKDVLYYNPDKGLIFGQGNDIYILDEKFFDDKKNMFRIKDKLRYIVIREDNMPILTNEIEKTRYAKISPLVIFLYLEKQNNKFYGEEAYGNVRYVRGKNKHAVIAASIKSLDIANNIPKYFNGLMPYFKKLLPEDDIDVYLLKSNKDGTDFEFLQIDDQFDDNLGKRFSREEVIKNIGCSDNALIYDKRFINVLN